MLKDYVNKIHPNNKYLERDLILQFSIEYIFRSLYFLHNKRSNWNFFRKRFDERINLNMKTDQTIEDRTNSLLIATQFVSSNTEKNKQHEIHCKSETWIIKHLLVKLKSEHYLKYQGTKEIVTNKLTKTKEHETKYDGQKAKQICNSSGQKLQRFEPITRQTIKISTESITEINLILYYIKKCHRHDLIIQTVLH